MWYLGWFWHALSIGANPLLVHGPLNYPYGMNLMWNTSIIGPAIIFGPLAHFFNLVFVYNLLSFFNLFVSFLFGELILRKLGTRPWLAIAGGILIGFMPYTISQSLGHLILTTTGALWGTLYLILCVLKTPPKQPALSGAVLGLLVSLQFYTSLEVFTSAVLVAGIIAVFYQILAPGFTRQLLGKIQPAFKLTAPLVATFLMAPGLFELFFGPYRPVGWLQPGNIYVIDLLNFIIPTNLFAVHNTFTSAISNRFTGNIAESDGYLGIPILLLLVWSLQRLWHQKTTQVLFYASLVLAVLSMGPFLHIGGHSTKFPLPWLFIQSVPFLYNILCCRLMLFVDFMIVLGIIWAMESFLASQDTLKAKILCLCGLFLAVASWLPVMPYPFDAPPKAGLALAAGGPFQETLRGQPTYILTSDFPQTMVWLADGGYSFPVINVYGHNSKPKWRRTLLLAMPDLLLGNKPLSTFQYRNYLITSLKTLGIKRLVFFPVAHGPKRLPPKVEQTISAVLGPPTAQAYGSILWKVPNKLPPS